MKIMFMTIVIISGVLTSLVYDCKEIVMIMICIVNNKLGCDDITFTMIMMILILS